MRHPTCIVVRRLARVESAHRCTAVGNAGRCGLRLSAEPKAACSQRDESSCRVRPVRAERDCGVRAGGAMRVAAYGMRTGGLQPAEAGDSGPPRGVAAGCAAVRRLSVGGEGGLQPAEAGDSGPPRGETAARAALRAAGDAVVGPSPATPLHETAQRRLVPLSIFGDRTSAVVSLVIVRGGIAGCGRNGSQCRFDMPVPPADVVRPVRFASSVVCRSRRCIFSESYGSRCAPRK